MPVWALKLLNKAEICVISDPNKMSSKILYKLFVKTVRPIIHRPMIVGSFTYNRFEEIFKKVMHFVWSNRVQGDYLEFGVYEGDSFTAAFRFAQLFGLDYMNFYAFDSFQGLPEISGVDAAGFKHYRESEFSCSLPEFKKNICRQGVDPERVKVVPGWYDKVLNDETKRKLQIKKAAVVMVDCDLYESTVPVLDFVTDYLQRGTILVFDDWLSYRADPDRGEQRAFREWLDKNPSIKVTSYSRFGTEGNSFIVTHVPE